MWMMPTLQGLGNERRYLKGCLALMDPINRHLGMCQIYNCLGYYVNRVRTLVQAVDQHHVHIPFMFQDVKQY